MAALGSAVSLSPGGAARRASERFFGTAAAVVAVTGDAGVAGDAGTGVPVQRTSMWSGYSMTPHLSEAWSTEHVNSVKAMVNVRCVCIMFLSCFSGFAQNALWQHCVQILIYNMYLYLISQQ